MTWKTSGPENFTLQVRFFGNPDWIEKDQIQASTRAFIYSASDLPASEIKELNKYGATLNHQVQFRSTKFALERKKREMDSGLN